MYLDAILNFGGPLQVISLLSLAFLFIATIITNFLPRLRLNGVSMILGFITGIVEIVLAVSNSALQEFEYSVYNKMLGERIVYDGQYSTGIVNIGIIISAIIMIAIVFIAHMIEKEKRYLTLTSNGTR